MASGNNLLVNYKSERLDSPDFRNVSPEPQKIERGIRTQFMTATVSGITTDGSYVGVMKWRSYANGTDLSGGPVKEIAYGNSRLFHRQSTSTTAWSAWRTLVDIAYNTQTGSDTTPVYISADGKAVAATNVSGRDALYLRSPRTISGTSCMAALQTEFSNNKTTIPRNCLITYYSSAHSNGSQLFGYFLSGYNDTPYGGFYVCHYTDAAYISISSGSYNEYIIDFLNKAQNFTADHSWGVNGAGGVLYGGATDGGINSMRIGNDIYLGDCNAGGILGLKSTGTNCGFYFHNSSGTQTGQFYNNGSNFYMNKLLLINTNSVTVTIGAQNSSYVHFTGGPQYYFDNPLRAVSSIGVYNSNTYMDSNDVHASRYVYTTYTNQSCGVEDGNIARIIYDNGDGWLRKASYAHLCNNLQGNFLRYNGWWSSGSGQNVNNALGMVFSYTNHGAPAGWGTTVTFEYQYNSNYRLQLHGEGYNGSLWWRSLSSDRGGWTTWLAACPLLSQNGYYGLKTPFGTDDWIRTTSQGIIPYTSGGYGSGHSGLGTSSWFFSYAYADNFYGNFRTSHGYINYGATNGSINMILAGDDAWIGDCNMGGVLGIKSNNSDNAGIAFYSSNGAQRGYFNFYNSEVHMRSDYTFKFLTLGGGAQSIMAASLGLGPDYSQFDLSNYRLCVNGATRSTAYYPSGSPGSNCYFGAGNGDGNGNGTANIIIRSWYGVGFMNGCTAAGTNGAITAGVDCRSGHIYANAVHNAVWNDYAECRQAETTEGGYCVTESKNGYMIKTTQRLMPACKLTSDTYGNIMGETEEAKTPIAVAGRVLVYTYQPRENYELGDAVCSAPNGTVDIMTREEIIMYPERIVGTVSEIPAYEIWHGGGKYAPQDIEVNGRIWIYVR